MEQKKKRYLCHVFITDNENKASSLRGQTLSDLPAHIGVYSAVFSIGQSGITSERMRALDEVRVSESWLHAMST